MAPGRNVLRMRLGAVGNARPWRQMYHPGTDVPDDAAAGVAARTGLVQAIADLIGSTAQAGAAYLIDDTRDELRVARDFTRQAAARVPCRLGPGADHGMCNTHQHLARSHRRRRNVVD